MEQRYFAKINKETKEVERVSVYDSLEPFFPEDELWIETFKDKSQRYNFAGIGCTYYEDYDAFVPPNPGTSESRILNLNIFIWEPSVPKPLDCPDHYFFDDDYCEWISMVGPANNGGYENADLIGINSTTEGLLYNFEGKVVGDITPRMQEINNILGDEIDLLE